MLNEIVKGFFPMKREKSNGKCPSCKSDKIEEKYSDLEMSFMKPYMNARLYNDLLKDRICSCGYEWIEK